MTVESLWLVILEINARNMHPSFSCELHEINRRIKDWLGYREKLEAMPLYLYPWAS